MSMLYRSSGIRTCLTETLEEMVENGILTAKLAFQVLLQFDTTITEAFKAQVRNNNVSVKGHLHTYQFYDCVWKFFLHNAVVRYQNNGGATVKENVDRLKIVACDSKSSAGLNIDL